jgi:cysteine-rich repeat protein
VKSVALLLSCLLTLIGGSLAFAGDTARLSVDAGGGDANGASNGPSVSADGRYVAFASTATDLVIPPTNGMSQIFRRDRNTNTTILVSVDGLGLQGNGASTQPAISADGNRVIFTSTASNLIGLGDGNGVSDVFLRDISGLTTTRVSVDSGGGDANGPSDEPAISADGLVASFTSDGDDLIADDNNVRSDVFVRDLVGNQTTRASEGPGGIEGEKNSFQSALSEDGRYVAFASESDNFFEIDDDWVDIFVRDRDLNTVDWLSVDPKGLGSDAPSFGPAISADGRYVAFQTFATNLISGDKNALGDVMVRDRDIDVTTRVSVDSNGEEGTGLFPGIDGRPSISADGRFVTFHTGFTNLIADDTNTCGICVTPGCCEDVFVHDRLTGRTERASIDSTGAQATGASLNPSIAGDGTLIAFASDAANLVALDGNGVRDVFGRAPVCGDGILDRGEQCDDGNTSNGDSCSSVCLMTCLPAPAVGCRDVAFPEKGRLVIKNKPEDPKDKLIWKWLKGDVSPKADFGNPLVGDSYILCLYDGAGLKTSHVAPAGGLCEPAKPCWKESTKGFQYKDKFLTPDGIQILKLSEGLAPGVAKILVKGKGDDLDLPDLSMLTSPVTVQLSNNDGTCWETVFSAPFQKQDAESFKDKSD